MLEIRPTCEHCNKDLPPNSDDAMICSFECTFCIDCVSNILKNVCPNCGGGFQKRPVRPIVQLIDHPASTIVVHKSIHKQELLKYQQKYLNIDPKER